MSARMATETTMEKRRFMGSKRGRGASAECPGKKGESRAVYLPPVVPATRKQRSRLTHYSALTPGDLRRVLAIGLLLLVQLDSLGDLLLYLGGLFGGILHRLLLPLQRRIKIARFR